MLEGISLNSGVFWLDVELLTFFTIFYISKYTDTVLNIVFFKYKQLYN